MALPDAAFQIRRVFQKPFALFDMRIQILRIAKIDLPAPCANGGNLQPEAFHELDELLAAVRIQIIGIEASDASQMNALAALLRRETHSVVDVHLQIVDHDCDLYHFSFLSIFILPYLKNEHSVCICF